MRQRAQPSYDTHFVMTSLIPAITLDSIPDEKNRSSITTDLAEKNFSCIEQVIRYKADKNQLQRLIDITKELNIKRASYERSSFFQDS